MRAKELLLLLVCLAVASTSVRAAEAPAARLLRVSLLEGDVTYQPTDLDRWVDLSINTPILEGDKIWVGRGGRAEVEFENGGFVRLSENTIMEFPRLADISSRDGVEVGLVQGLASFDVRAEPAFTIQTPLFSNRLNDAASFRIDVETDGSGRLVVFTGTLEVSGSGARLLVRNGEVVRFLSKDPERYYLETDYVKDEWDRWIEERQDYLTKITQEQFHNGDRGWTTADLYNYGSWYDVPTYGRVWRPASVEEDWVPFRSGRWVWYPAFGWTWISYEPWGWIPYHYGRWAHVNGYGWSWVPGPRYVSWCPGAVNWVQGTQWVGWVPLAPHEPWYGHGHDGVNVFVSKNFGHRGSVTYLPHDSFVNGTPPRGFHSPRDPYADGRIIAGQPRITPTPASRMPVVGNPTSRVFTNEDLEARRNMRERIVNVGRTSSPQVPSTETERMRRLNSAAASTYTNSAPATSSPGIRTIPSISTRDQTAPTRSNENWNRDGSAARSEQRQRIYQMGATPPSSTEPSPQRQSPSTWVRPTAPVPQPSLDSAASASPNSSDRFSARERVYEVYRGRTNSGRTDRYSSQPAQRETPSTRYTPYTPPSTPPAMSHPAGPTASYNGPAARPVGPPPSYQGPSSSRESVPRSEVRNSDSGASSQESRGAARGRTGR